MEMPTVATDFPDVQRKILYRVLAYRTVTQTEGLQVIALWQRQQKKAPKAGSVVQIISLLGAND